MNSIFDLPNLCVQHGVKHVVICPGSRSAPLTLAFARTFEINKHIIPDERTAAYVALGIAEATNSIVALVCTSGTAAYNFAPAIAEAFFKNVPLLILTADRPQEWIAQQDGQTIFQENMYGKHVKKSIVFPVSFEKNEDKWFANRILNESLLLCKAVPQGPVHLNVPLREPLYNQQITTEIENLRVINNFLPTATYDFKPLFETLTQYSKIIIVVGQSLIEDKIMLGNLPKNIVVIGDFQADIHASDNVIKYHDLFLGSVSTQVLSEIEPDLVITLGNSIISKSLKTFLRNSTNLQHWHVGNVAFPADVFQKLTLHIKTSGNCFVESLNSFLITNSLNQDYFSRWQKMNNVSEKFIADYFIENDQFNEFIAVSRLLSILPNNSVFHVANSMAVRYANIISTNKNIEFNCNRGTSGIDGCTSTAIGHALVNNKLNVFLTGDIAFFYDRNAFWLQNLPANFKIVLLNNQAGGIFRMIDGSNEQPELEQYFETTHQLSAENLANDFKLDYLKVLDIEGLEPGLEWLLTKTEKCAILEIKTDKHVNTTYFKNFKQKAKEYFNKIS